MMDISRGTWLFQRFFIGSKYFVGVSLLAVIFGGGYRFWEIASYVPRRVSIKAMPDEAPSIFLTHVDYLPVTFRVYAPTTVIFSLILFCLLVALRRQFLGGILLQTVVGAGVFFLTLHFLYYGGIVGWF